MLLGTLPSVKSVSWSWATEGEASKGPWGACCHMLLFRKMVVKDRQIADKKIPQKKKLASEVPAIEKEIA